LFAFTFFPQRTQMMAAAGMLFLQKGHSFVEDDRWGGGSDCGGMMMSALQMGQLIDNPAPVSSTTRFFPHPPQLKKMSGILSVRADYLPDFWATTIHRLHSQTVAEA
jgi:hypothetical protein